MRNQQFRVFSFSIIIYMLCALLWWAVLLQRNNAEIFHLRQEIISIQSQNPEDAQIKHTELESEYKRNSYMIIGEGIVFGITLALGIFFVNRALIRELKASIKQKNFLLSITHELKSPLASIHLILETIIKRNLPQDKVKELSQDALGECNRLEDLFNKILLATRLDTAYQYHNQTANISHIIEKEIDRATKLDSNLIIETDIEKDVYSYIDPEAFLSMFKNILENGIKYSPNGLPISVSLKESKNQVLLEVVDQGEGIPNNEKRKVFDQFYRIGSEETRKSKGTGLGLFIVNEIVHAHGGKISIHDNNPKGTRISINLPKKNELT